ncbi:hypothetical protein [Vibrio cincinnatiensis]|uniref:hypothetical protein n=1 Tax=Vibrio cincinnatiensis TaxID=675 RepID=UPI001EDD86C6|nr:hypothetical protein [Vibrio cincinnatiensis]MCG3721378.1 hypothetical protein [Vibrio cincinnatiensis]
MSIQTLSQVREILSKLDPSMPLKADDMNFEVFVTNEIDDETGNYLFPLEAFLCIRPFNLDIKFELGLDDVTLYTVGFFLEHVANLPDMVVSVQQFSTNSRSNFSIVHCAPCRPHDLDERFYMFMSEGY